MAMYGPMHAPPMMFIANIAGSVGHSSGMAIATARPTDDQITKSFRRPSLSDQRPDSSRPTSINGSALACSRSARALARSRLTPGRM